MVATRQATQRDEPQPPLAGRSGHASETEELTSAESSSTPMVTRSRSKVHSHPKVIPLLEKMTEPETTSDVAGVSDVQAAPNRSKAIRLVDSVAEFQGDGEISEAESTCSSMSGLNTPLTIRVTRRRKIVVPCQPESSAKTRQNRRALANEGGRSQDDDDISESESCASTISGARTPTVAKGSKRRQMKANVVPVSEAEEASDAESWCSGISTELYVPFKRITRSMRLKPQWETILQNERKNEIIEGVEKLTEHTAQTPSIVISDSEQPTKSDLDTVAVSSTQSKDKPSLLKITCCSESVVSSDTEQIISQSPKKLDEEHPKQSPEKEKPTNHVLIGSTEGKKRYTKEFVTRQLSNDVYEIVESTDELSDVIIEKPSKVPVESTDDLSDVIIEKSSKITVKQSPVKSKRISKPDCRILNIRSKSQRKATPTKSVSNLETHEKDTGKITQSSFQPSIEVIDVEKLSGTGSPQKEIPLETIESSDDESRISVLTIDTDGSQDEPVAQSSLGASKKPGDEKCVSLISDESDSDLEDTNEVDVTADDASTSNQNSQALDEVHSKELFVIDKTPGLDSSKAYYFEEKETAEAKESEESSDLEEREEEFIDEDEDDQLLNASNKVVSFSSRIDPGLNIKQLGGLYISFDVGKQKPGLRRGVPQKEKKKDELLKNSIITPGFEKKECVPPLRESVRQLKKKRRAERAKTTGDGWFGMKAPEMTSELKNDLKALKMRAAIDPKRFYKKNDREGLPKYVQVGTVLDSPADFYHARIPKKERKKTIVEELLADSEFRRYNKRKFQDIMAEKTALAAGKKLRKKKKFSK